MHVKSFYQFLPKITSKEQIKGREEVVVVEPFLIKGHKEIINCINLNMCP